jgi:DNA-binding response OmpR family regulator
MNGILILEDDDSVNRGISFSLEREGFTVFSCGLVQEAKRVLATEHPEILICDLNLPDDNGLDFIRYARAQSNSYIICLTALDQETDQIMGYGAGADDYVTKPFSIYVLLLKIKACQNRLENKSTSLLSTGALQMDPSSAALYRDHTQILLTPTEWKLLTLFTQYPKQILSKRQILEQLFDNDGHFVDENTIAVNINRLREKIEPDRSKPMYIKNVRGLGYIWDQAVTR